MDLGTFILAGTLGLSLYKCYRKHNPAAVEGPWVKRGFTWDVTRQVWIGTLDGRTTECREGELEVAGHSRRGVLVHVLGDTGGLHVDPRPGDGDRPTGDIAFDARYSVSGDGLAAAQLTAALRNWMVQIPEDMALRVGTDGYTVLLPGGTLAVSAMEVAVAAVAPVIAAMPQGDVVSRALAVARHDPLPGMRALALWGLAEAHVPVPFAREILSDPDPAVRIGAAVVLAAGGEDASRVLLETVGSDARWFRLLGALKRLGARTTLLAVLPRLRRTVMEPALLVEVVRESLVVEDPTLATQLGPLLRHGAPEVVRAAMAAMLKLEVPTGEEDVLSALTLGYSSIEALEWLGRFGTVASVPGLAAFAESGNAPRPTRAAATVMIRRIQARLQGAGAGQLSLGGLGGEVDVAPQRGAVAVVPPAHEA